MIFDSFTAANTARGFYSYFDELINAKGLSRVYLIKGGPGSGKSTFMKKLAGAASEAGHDVERIYCSSDCGSLDGVHITDKGIVVIDATAPHAHDMRYPGARDSLIDLSVFWDENRLKKDRAEIERLFCDISGRYKLVYSLLRAAGSCEAWKTEIIDNAIDYGALTNGVKKIIKQNAIMPTDKTGVNTNRMLSAFTGSGIFTLSDTVDILCDEYIVFDDRSGISHISLNKLQGYFAKVGYDTLSIHSPLLPESRLESVLIPELRLGFIADGHVFSPELKEEKIIKRINTKKYLDKNSVSANKNKLSLAKKLTSELYCAVAEEMSEIKRTHDELEKHYISAMDFDKLNRYTEQYINKILNNN